jgi:hypothetical protein
MSSEATYKIKFDGKLSDDWANWFNGSNISVEVKEDNTPQTTLICRVRDQAELIGILNRLNSLCLPLFEVVYMERS